MKPVMMTAFWVGCVAASCGAARADHHGHGGHGHGGYGHGPGFGYGHHHHYHRPFIGASFGYAPPPVYAGYPGYVVAAPPVVYAPAPGPVIVPAPMPVYPVQPSPQSSFSVFGRGFGFSFTT